MKAKIILGVAFVMLVVGQFASAAVDTNVSDGVTLSGTLTNTALSSWMQPPLAYVTGVVLFMMVFGIIAGIIKGRRRGKG